MQGFCACLVCSIRTWREWHEELDTAKRVLLAADPFGSAILIMADYLGSCSVLCGKRSDFNTSANSRFETETWSRRRKTCNSSQVDDSSRVDQIVFLGLFHILNTVQHDC